MHALLSPARNCSVFLLSWFCLAATTLHSAEPVNLVVDGEFETWEPGKPAGWSTPTPQTYQRGEGPEGGASLKVSIVKAIDGKSGEVSQKISVQPNTDYQLSGQVRADTAGGAILQVKRFQGGKEVERLSSKKTKATTWAPASVRFNSGSSDQIQVLLRWQQEQGDVGRTVEFAKLSLVQREKLTYSGPEVPPRAEATYNCIGLYWKPQGGRADRPVSAEYRKKGDSTWKEALPLWFDATEHDEDAAAHTAEYRGSLVYLTPDTDYEVKLSMKEGPERILNTRTRSDNFKIARRVTLPTPASGTLVITEGGAEGSYVLYEPEPSSKPWDGGGVAPENLRIEASYVIVKGFTLKNALTHGIVLGNVHDVIIDGCDISGWGETAKDGQAKDLNAAVYSKSRELKRITVQNCQLHHPRSDSNSWNEQRPGTESKHPQGPQGVVFVGGQGGHVIRSNRIYSDIDHMFNDGMGDVHNFTYSGFPVCDSDIHDNFVSHCWDDGLEIEGADMNVRVWNNYIDMTYGGIGAASPSLGPLYIFRNVYGVSRKHSGNASNDLRGHYLVKLGNESAKWTKGRMYIFHNTTLQPPTFPGSSEKSSGAQSGIVFTSEKKLQENIVTRNNLLHMRGPKDWAIRDTQLTGSNDFDYDMLDGQVMFKDGSQLHGVKNSPTYNRTSDGRLALAPGTAGHDVGAKIPNFNDDFAGQAPDIGAVETDGKDSKPSTWPEFPEPPATSPAPAAAPTISTN